VKSKVAPGDRLVQERVDIRVATVEALAPADRVRVEHRGAPVARRGQHRLRDLRDREVSEVEIRAEAALVGGGGRRGPRAALRRAAQAMGHEVGEASSRRRRAARGVPHRRHAPIERQRGDQPVEIVERRRLERRGGRRPLDHARPRGGPTLPRLRERAVDPWPQLRGGRDRGAETAQGHDAVGVDRDHRHVGRGGEGRGLGGHDEGGEVVGDHQRGARGQDRHEPAAVAGAALHPGPVGQAEPGRRLRVGLHALQHEAVQARAGPGIAQPQTLVDHQGPGEAPGLAKGVIEGVIVREPPGRLHPVEDVLAGGADGPIVGTAHARSVSAHH
jgi:hypothetical protein